jgi:hypothetical protein
MSGAAVGACICRPLNIEAGAVSFFAVLTGGGVELAILRPPKRPGIADLTGYSAGGGVGSGVAGVRLIPANKFKGSYFYCCPPGGKPFPDI